jgi:hypothetical protein
MAKGNKGVKLPKTTVIPKGRPIAGPKFDSQGKKC